MVKLKPASMAEPPLPLMVSLSLLLLLLLNSATRTVQCFDQYQKKLLISLQTLQWQMQTGTTSSSSSAAASSSSSSCLSQRSRTEKGAVILEMKHRDQCSGKILDWNKEQNKRLILDNLHVRYLQSRIRNTNSSGDVKAVSDSNAEIPLTSGIKLQTLNYVVTVDVGGEKMTVIVDTGSVLTWVQCQPCQSCYAQQDPLFNPSVSASYRKVLCNSSACQSLRSATGNSGVCSRTSGPPTCNYYASYGDGSYTRGDLGSERLVLGTTPVKDFVIGCGRNNRGLFGGASGIMGLGRSDLSLVSQTKSMFGGIFSYCLPPPSQAKASGSLVLGGESSLYKNSTPITFTRLVQNPLLSTFYVLNLTGITIGGVSLPGSSFGNGEILIDSGTVITRLPRRIYNAFKAEFLKQFSGFPPAPGFSILDTCFNLSGYREVNIPVVKMEFEGEGKEENAEMEVDVMGVFYFVKADATQVCLALASLSYGEDIGIIGNYQQKNQRVVYDTKESKVGFAGESCSSL